MLKRACQDSKLLCVNFSGKKVSSIFKFGVRKAFIMRRFIMSLSHASIFIVHKLLSKRFPDLKNQQITKGLGTLI